MEELYKKYVGVEVTTSLETESTQFKGIICGYTDNELVLAVTEYISGKWEDGWYESNFGAVIVTHKDNPLGYWYINEQELPKL